MDEWHEIGRRGRENERHVFVQVQTQPGKLLVEGLGRRDRARTVDEDFISGYAEEGIKIGARVEIGDNVVIDGRRQHQSGCARVNDGRRAAGVGEGGCRGGRRVKHVRTR